MKTMKLMFVSLAVFSSHLLIGQTAERKFALDFSLINNEYKGDYGNGIFDLRTAIYPAGGLNLSVYLNRSFNAGLGGSYGNYGFYSDEGFRFSMRKIDADFHLDYKFNNGYLLSKEARLYPLLTLGVGLAAYNDNFRLTSDQYPERVTSGLDLIIPLGAGLKYQINNRFALQYKYLYNFTNKDLRDENRGLNAIFPRNLEGNDRFGKHVLSFVFTLGKATDKDKDGVPDKRDLCLDTPQSVTVDSNGCPVDSDNDGVPDYLDMSPNTPIDVKVDTEGRPIDSDKDGVADYLDKSPNTPAGVKVDAEGRPIDSDNDGVADYLDKCDKTPVGIKIDANGCPVDSDKDGVADYLDKSPDTPAGVKVDAEGRPIDTDKDGVADYLDKCPNEFGITANKGCPEVKEEAKKIFTKALQGIQFETGKEVIKKTSYPILNMIADIMKINPAYLLEINGHSDSQGEDNKNLILSQQRADAVKQYLIGRSIDGDRMASKGYGETMPVGDNNTAAGRAKNRRVEFKVVF
jgi:outer membrane protein OmpA-like peptidoglycan-associated protein